MIGLLMYLTTTRPDIQFFTVLCTRYQSNLKESHLTAMKRILRKSTSCACQILGGKLVCWIAKKQQSVAMSSTEAAGCCASILWIKSQLSDYDIHYKMKAFTNCPSVVYQNFLREFWSTVVAYDLFPSTNETEQCPLREFLIKFSVLNGQRPLTLDFNTFCSSTGLDYNNGKYVAHPTPEVLGGNYSSTEQVNSIQQLLAYCLIIGTEVDIGEIIYSDLKDSVYPLPLAAKPKKGKSQIVTLTLPKSQGPEAPGALSKKRQKTPISSDTVPDPKDLERNIQLASTGLPSTLDKGTLKSQPLPESTATLPKDSEGNIQPLDRDLTSTT
ncbi:hypothetical protein Tco_1218421 [Tanacetum coccineum]